MTGFKSGRDDEILSRLSSAFRLVVEFVRAVPKDSDEYMEKADSLSRIAYRRASHQNLDEKARIFWERLDKSLK